MEKDKKRGERRDRTVRYGARAQRVHVGVNHPSGDFDCICERSIWYFQKRKSLGCRCRSRKRGAPKLNVGFCHLGPKYRPSLIERIAMKRLARAWLERCGAVDLDDVELGFRRVRLY